VTVDPLSQPPPCTTPSPCLTTEHADDAHADIDDADEKKRPPTVRERWVRIWPSLLAVVTLPAVGGPAAVASYRHARDVIAEHGDAVMAPWLALTTDGMLLAALVAIWVRRHRREQVRAGPWAAFWAGMAATIAANLAAAHPTPVGVVVALWPPVCLAITLELVALVASPAKHHPIITDTLPAERIADVPGDAQPAPEYVPAETARKDRAPQACAARHGSGTSNGRLVGEMPAELSAETTRVPAGTNGHGHGLVPVGVSTSPAPDLRDVAEPVGQVPALASGYGSGMEPVHEAGDNGHHGPVRTGRGRVSDGDILAWLREQTCTTGRVPGRRKMIDMWVLGSTRAERLRRVVLDEAAHNEAAYNAAACAG